MMLLGKVATGLLATALLAGGIVSSEGFLHVRVMEKRKNGTHLNLILPAMAVPIALWVVPARHLRVAGKNVRRWVPAIDATTRQLATSPDGTLVDVNEPGQHVTVAKSGSSLVIDVDDPGETVHVSVPLETVRSAADILATRTDPN